MPRAALTGTRIRALRTARRLAQADLARLAGVSPSYLNLIEHNRRRAGPTLLGAIATALQVPPEALAEASAEAQLAALRAAATAAAPGTAPELDRAEEFAGRFPGWAGLVGALHARTQAQDRAIERLSDRMAHDPNLAAALSEIVAAVTAVQSTAAILAETDDLEPEWRNRFHANIHADSVRLAHAAEALVAWLDSADQETGLAAPLEEVESWLARRGFHLSELEPPAPDAPADATPAVVPDPEALIAGQPDLASQAGRALARDWLARWAAEAQALPATRLSAALAAQLAAGQGLDPGGLAQALGVAPGLVLRRLALLPPGPAVPRFGLVLCDGSGTPTFRRPLDGFALPRFGGACPAWPLFEALQQPGRPLRMVLETTARPALRVLAFALAEPREPARFAPPMAWESAMLITPAAPAVLAPQDGDGPARPVGAGCRVCALADCAARREPSIVLGQ